MMATPQPTATRGSQSQKSLTISPVAKDGIHRQKKKGDICPICVDPIVDSGKGKKGQDAVFCDGVCKL